MPHFPIKLIVLHYSATYPDQDYGVADIRKMHLARGFNDVGYHYVIRRSGAVERGRADTTVGAHVSGHNTGSLGICCIGGIERVTGPNVGVDNRAEAQKVATVKLVRELLAKHPGAQVVGHRDLTATQCPGFDVRSWWAAANARPPVVDSIPVKPLPSRSTPVTSGPAKGPIYILAALAAAALAFLGVK
ncbi:N-acetylmuramoyl-L-alanine amidase [uncultured Paracoccus sp.]|jgi:N-acetyl-anhydromuramyl-L-alanine amidase AmpD|uniref:N-acetylmuramoyl-L-alanine amidase n=1 Tax=uncultured Paracoccus sp. TaxID=189685 RepID=UPI0030DAA24B|tara:strand:- start:3880 stop:4446 length:567 start_codon:yes stop_codon:yes gene_type:complete